jgi:hypothetical protein
VRRGLNPEALRRTLLHEMCNVAAPGDHGTFFREELRKLARRGEKWAKEEIQLYRLYPTASFHEFELKYGIEDLNFLRVDLEDLAMRASRPRFSEVLRFLAEQLEMMGMNSRDLSMRAPWLKTEWRRVRRKYDRQRRRAKGLTHLDRGCEKSSPAL